MEPIRLLEIFNKMGRGTFVFSREISKIILGSCCNGFANMYQLKIGFSTIEGTDSIRLAFFEHYLRGVSGNVILVSECCGQYGGHQLEDLRMGFPEVIWIVPHIPDFGDSFEWTEMLEPLLKEGILVRSA